MDDMCTDNRFELIKRFKKKLIESTNIETSPEEMKAIDSLLFRFWQMGWLDIIDRMPLVKESAKTLMHSDGNSVSAKAFRNAGRFVQNAIDGEAPELELIPSAQPETKQGEWIPLREQLPEDGKWCLFTDGVSMSVERYKEDALDHFFPEGRWFRLEDAIAWMSLPEPYQEESEE